MLQSHRIICFVCFAKSRYFCSHNCKQTAPICFSIYLSDRISSVPSNLLFYVICAPKTSISTNQLSSSAVTHTSFACFSLWLTFVILQSLKVILNVKEKKQANLFITMIIFTLHCARGVDGHKRVSISYIHKSCSTIKYALWICTQINPYVHEVAGANTLMWHCRQKISTIETLQNVLDSKRMHRVQQQILKLTLIMSLPRISQYHSHCYYMFICEN